MKKIDRKALGNLLINKATELKLLRELKKQGFIRSTTTTTTTTTP